MCGDCAPGSPWEAATRREGLRERDERQAWDRFAVEAMRQALYLAPVDFGDRMADAPALLADTCADVADRMLEKRRARFGTERAPRCPVSVHHVGEGDESRQCRLIAGHAFEHRWEGER
jgi:hypothetical protein